MKQGRSLAVRRAREVLRIESEAVGALAARLGEEFDRVVDIMLRCKGRVIVTGMGKPGIIGRKIAATLASTGTPAVCLHPAEAVHGDLGIVVKDDVVLAISNSGETEEVVRLLPVIKSIGATLVAMTGRCDSTLASQARAVLDTGVMEEACPLGLVPTASTTAMLAMGDALAVALLEKRGFNREDYALYHPAGNLGRILLGAGKLVRSGTWNVVVKGNTPVREVIMKITEARAPAACIVDRSGRLSGLVTQAKLWCDVVRKPELVCGRIEQLVDGRPPVIHEKELEGDVWERLRSLGEDIVAIVDGGGRPVGLLDRMEAVRGVNAEQGIAGRRTGRVRRHVRRHAR